MASQYRKLRDRQAQTFSEFPPCLIYRPGNLADPGLDVEILYSQLIIELEKMQNLFFIERLLLRHGQKDTGELLSISFDMVT